MCETKSTLKVIFVGSSAVGKTSLIGALFSQDFVEDLIPTVAPTFNVVDIRQSSGNVVSLQIWDTAGQERYYSVNQLFYRDTDIACVCYDPGNQKSKEAIQSWIKSVTDEVPTVKMFLILTKMDLYSDEEKEAFQKESLSIKEELNFEEVFYTSAVNKTGYERILMTAANYFKANIDDDLITKERELKEADVDKKGCCK